jgi:hypothetical protein
MDAAEAGAAALALFEEKGNTVGADRAQALLVEVAAV